MKWLFASLCVLLMLGLGVVLCFPWLLSVTVQTPFWHNAVMWSSELFAAVGTGLFLVKRLLSGPPASQPANEQKAWDWIALATILAGALDIGASYYFDYLEQHARRAAKQGACEFVEAKVYSDDGFFITALLQCRIQDGVGDWHNTWWYAKGAHLRRQDREKIRAGQLPFVRQAPYDPDHPVRFWPEAAGVTDTLSAVHLGVGVTAFSLIFSLFAIALQQKWAPADHVPLCVFSFVGVSCYLFFTGVGMLMSGDTAWLPV